MNEEEEPNQDLSNIMETENIKRPLRGIYPRVSQCRTQGYSHTVESVWAPKPGREMYFKPI